MFNTSLVRKSTNLPKQKKKNIFYFFNLLTLNTRIRACGPRGRSGSASSGAWFWFRWGGENVHFTRIINAWWEFPRVFFLWVGKIKHVLCKVVWFRTGGWLLAFKQTAFFFYFIFIFDLKQTAFSLPLLLQETQQTA